jgi:hypothetical protein
MPPSRSNPTRRSMQVVFSSRPLLPTSAQPNAKPLGFLIRRSQRPAKFLRDRRGLGPFARPRLQHANVLFRPRSDLRRLLRSHSSLQATHFSTGSSFNLHCCNFATIFLSESSMLSTSLSWDVFLPDLPRISRGNFSQAGPPWISPAFSTSAPAPTMLIMLYFTRVRDATGQFHTRQ